MKANLERYRWNPPMLFCVVIVLGKHRSVIEYDGKLLSFWEKTKKGLIYLETPLLYLL